LVTTKSSAVLEQDEDGIRALGQVNLFRDAKTMAEGNPQVLREQLLASRVLMTLLLVSLSVLLVITTVIERGVSETVSNPSLATYIHLQNTYPSTISCPCRNITIPYKTFLNITPNYHQVCSSEFVSPQWIASLLDVDTIRLTPLDFRASAAAQFRLLRMICWVGSALISNEYAEFIQGQFVTDRVLQPSSFAEEADALIKKFAVAIKLAVNADRSVNIIMFVIMQSHLHPAIGTDAIQLSQPGSNVSEQIINFYPQRENATIINVSCRKTEGSRMG
jgi:hypothetical protein